MNRCLSSVMQTKEKADQFMQQHLLDIRSLAESHGVRLVLMGPLFGSWFPPSFADESVVYFRDQSKLLELPLIDASGIHADDESLWIGDGSHLSSEGHERLAGEFLQTLRDCSIVS